MQPNQNDAMSSALDAIFGDNDGEETTATAPETMDAEPSIPQEAPEPEQQVEPEPQPQPQEPVSLDDGDIPDTLLSNDQQDQEDESDLLPLPSDNPDQVPDEARSVVEKYAFETREERRRRKAAEAKVKELTEGNEKSSLEPEEKQRLERQIEELENELGRLDLSRSPEFNRQYGQPIQEIDNLSTTILRRAGMEESDATRLINQIASEPDLRQREIIIEDVDNLQLPPSLMGSLIQNSVRRDELVQVREKALQDWKSSRAAVEERAVQERQARDAKEVRALLSTAINSVRAENNPFYKRTEADSSWNEVVDHFESAVTGVLQRNDKNEIAKLVAHGLTFPRLLSRYSTERSRRQALERDMLDGDVSSPPEGTPSAKGPVARAQSEAPKTTKEILETMFP
jgi:hypothetical protein